MGGVSCNPIHQELGACLGEQHSLLSAIREGIGEESPPLCTQPPSRGEAEEIRASISQSPRACPTVHCGPIWSTRKDCVSHFHSVRSDFIQSPSLMVRFHLHPRLPALRSDGAVLLDREIDPDLAVASYVDGGRIRLFLFPLRYRLQHPLQESRSRA